MEAGMTPAELEPQGHRLFSFILWIARKTWRAPTTRSVLLPSRS